jgi:hypothetical protein
MAKVNGIVESKISGLVGPVVFVNFNGRTYVRRAPRPRKKEGWSIQQVSSRKRFSNFCAFWREQVPATVKEIWDLASEKMNGFNLFLKVNLQAFGAEGNLEDLTRFHFAQGSLPLPHKLTATRMQGNPGMVQISWQDDSGIGLASADDQLLFLTTNGKQFNGPLQTKVRREEEAALIQLPEESEAITGIFLFFKSSKGKLYSPDQFFGI